MKEGQAFEQEKNWESAFTRYEEAANLGSGEAAYMIAMLYLEKSFRQVDDNTDIMKKILSGVPIMPWDMGSKKEPDYKQAIHWLKVGVAHNYSESGLILGLMMCTGEGCPKNISKGVAYLEEAAANGNVRAKVALDIYKPIEAEIISDEEYEQLLKSFEEALPETIDKPAKIYAKLKGGSEKQKARLGYVLMK